jgi:hypothetical protein
MQKQDPTLKDEGLEILLAEIDSMSEYAGIHDDSDHVHRGRLIRIFRRQVPFLDITSPITADDEFSIKHGHVISLTVEATPSGNGALPPGYGVRVDQGHILQRVDSTPPFPKAPEKEDLTVHEERNYAMMLIGPSFHDYAFPDAEALFRRRDTSLRDGIKLSPVVYAQRLDSFKNSIKTFADALRKYQETANESLTQLRIKRFLSWIKHQPIYAHYSTTELADILERQKTVRDILDDYKQYLEYNPPVGKATIF